MSLQLVQFCLLHQFLTWTPIQLPQHHPSRGTVEHWVCTICIYHHHFSMLCNHYITGLPAETHWKRSAIPLIHPAEQDIFSRISIIYLLWESIGHPAVSQQGGRVLGILLYLNRVLADKSSGSSTESQQLYFLQCGMGMMALNKEEDLGGQNHGNSIVVGIGMIEWEVEAATTTAAATVPGWILVCELLQFNMGNVELPIQVSTCSLTHISPWMQ